jgi:hypothetical protein
MVVFDASEKPLEQNIAETRRGVEAVKSIRPAMLVEGEVGYVGSGSEIYDKRPDNIVLTEPEDARRFVAETKVDLLAPSVGTTHGMLKSMIQGMEHKLRANRSHQKGCECTAHVTRRLRDRQGRLLQINSGGDRDDPHQHRIACGLAERARASAQKKSRFCRAV